MQYMLLIYGSEERWQDASEEEQRDVFQRYTAFSQALRDRGAYVAGEPLQQTATATTVRVRGDETLTTDGPFAETKEQLGGFYIIDVDTIDEAIEWAARIPAAEAGSIEVRPIMPVPVREQV
jgi:hypothetical protein